MKNIPNMPATVSAWMKLAPETLRERKSRSGMSGLRAVASRAMNAARSTSAPAPSSSVSVAPQPFSDAGETSV